MVEAIFFDAVGTLLHLSRGVGYHYAIAGRQVGAEFDPAQLDKAFGRAWKEMPPRPAEDGPREDDDKGWWRALVEKMLAKVPNELNELDRDAFFEAAYSHFAEAGVWETYPEVEDVLKTLSSRQPLFIISNFDGRLRIVLERLALSRYFRNVFVSSELGADKPDPEIFRRAVQLSGFEAEKILHAGDDPERDWAAATTAGLQVFKLRRPENSLRDLLSLVPVTPRDA